MLGHNLNHSDPRPPGGQPGEVGGSIKISTGAARRRPGRATGGAVAARAQGRTTARAVGTATRLWAIPALVAQGTGD